MKVLIVGDLHLPFDHPNYLKFLRDQVEVEKPDKIVFIGDFIDHYALSRFTLDPDQQGQKPEFQKALKKAQPYYDLFPEAIWIVGNHDRRPYRKATEIGLGGEFTKGLKDIYCCPPKWKVMDSVEIDGVFYYHGETGGGASGWQNASLLFSQSVCFGHYHSVAGVRYVQNVAGEQMFTMVTGAGVDDRAYAFAYGKNFPKKSVLSCGVIEDGVYAKVVPMNMRDRKYRRIR